MKQLYILKLGGSVVTEKDKVGGYLREKLLVDIAKEILKARRKKEFDLILVHGAGAVGHQLAHEYKLTNGIKTSKQWLGSFISRVANPQMDLDIAKIFIHNKLPITSVHTASAVVQNDKVIDYFNLTIVKEALRSDCIPMIYGEMTFDKALGMSVCSGDAITAYLAKKLKVNKMFFASDIDGIFDQDPHKYKNTQLIEEISLKTAGKIKMLGSHNVDVTGGLAGKIKSLSKLKNTGVESIEIFNGLKKENYTKVFLDKKFPHTTIKIK